APENRPRVIVNQLAVEGHVLPVTLHGQLLQVSGKAFQVLLVRKNGNGLSIEKVRVPNREQSQEHWQILFEWRRAEMLVHFVEAVEQGGEMFRPNRKQGRKANGRINRIASADPIPEAKHVHRINAERGYLFSVGGYGDEMSGHRLDITAESL